MPNETAGEIPDYQREFIGYLDGFKHTDTLCRLLEHYRFTAAEVQQMRDAAERWFAPKANPKRERRLAHAG